MIRSSRLRNFFTDLGWLLAILTLVFSAIATFKGVGLLVAHWAGVR